jgi:hypothetical protein
MGALTEARTVDWAAYRRWNAALADEFFGGRYGGRPVYLDLEPDALRRVARAAEHDGDDPEHGLIAVVGPTLHLGMGVSLFGAHRRALARWRTSGREGAPPIVAVLSLLSLVAEQMHSDAEFRASNYYGRFLQTLFVDPTDRQLRSKVLRGFADETHLLWKALNDWIREDEAVRGIPTAFAFDYRVHVGIPMSQALVRAPDREALRGLFMDYRLQPGQAVARSDMVRLLEQWLPTSPTSRGLKRLAQAGDVVERIAEVACVELEAWDGESDSGQAHSRAELAVIGQLRRRPRARLDLRLAVRTRSELPLDRLVLDDGASPGACAALRPLGGAMVLHPADNEGWHEVEDASSISMADALVSVLSLRSGELQVMRQPRRLVLLERDEQRLRFVEAARARLGVECLLLAAGSLAAELDAELERIARLGYDRFTPDQLRGLPADWVAYAGVELVAITTSARPELSALVPVAWTQVTLGGGLALPGRSNWHSLRAPEVRASSYAGGRVLAILTNESDAAGENPDSDDGNGARGSSSTCLGVFEGAGIFPLAPRQLADGDYRVTLLDGSLEGRALSSALVRVRSADSAEPDERRSARLAHRLGPGAALGAISATASADREDAVRGAAIPRSLEPAVIATGASAPAALRTISDDAPDNDDEPSPPLAPRATEAARLDCMETGAHHFLLPAVQPGRSRRGRRGQRAYQGRDDIGGRCKYCGFEKFFPARPRRASTQHAPTRAAAATQRLERAAARPDVPARSEDGGLDHDALLDAVSYLGEGSWATFARLVAQLDERPWAAIEEARLLSSLGHVDVELSPTDLRPVAWEVAPPTLVVSERVATLAGFRSLSLLRSLAASARRLGGEAATEKPDSGPTHVTITGLDHNALCSLATKLAEDGGPAVRVSVDAAARLASTLPALRDVRAALPRGRLPPDEQLELFDARSGRWQRAEHSVTSGAYRTRRLPRRTWHIEGDDARVADARLAKWLAAAGREPYLGWSADTQTLVCHQSAPLPGLYERAAVLASGYPPTARADGHLAYRDVSRELAVALSARLDVPTAGGRHAT